MPSFIEPSVACKPILRAALSGSVMFDTVDGRDNEFTPENTSNISEIRDVNSVLSERRVFADQLTIWNDCGKSPAQT